ncbi:MAG TPA: serine hydrolase [Streptosporangiaceae bacterium]|jgi:D-alanyl-D-alanine carboxypeptidase (penicillin-binding protein 5/6)|nr:serine hydrolase [Streptosporangiaceae bacterium]
MHLPARFSALALAGALLLVPVEAAPALAAPAARAATAAPDRLASATSPAVATSPALARAPRGVQAKGGALANAATGAVLWSRGMNTKLPMGSITKVMTAIVVLRAGNLHQRIVVPKGVVPYDRKYDASNAGLRPGDYLTAQELLEALLLPSGCDAAYALAKAYGPGWTAFIAKMNSTAHALGLAHTHFSNFDGLPWPTETSTYSTPRDLIALGRAAMGYPVLRSIVDQRTYRLAASPRHHAYVWRTTNMLLRDYPGAIGIKTGSTRAAGYCLLFEARKNGHALVGVVLHSSQNNDLASFADATKILDWGFRHD